MNVVDKKQPFLQPRGRALQRTATITANRAEINPQYQSNNGVFHRLTIRNNFSDANNAQIPTAKTPLRNFRPPGTSSSSARGSSRRKNSTPRSAAVTTGRSSSTSRTPAHLPIILAITEGRGDARGEVGIAAVNVQHPHLVLSQISDRHNYINTLIKILVYKPIEILMPETMIKKSGTGGKLFECVKEKFPGINIAGIARNHFNNTMGLERIRTLCAKEYSSVEIYVKQKFYALAAAAALLKYVEYTQNILYIPNTMKIEFQTSEDTTVIDIESAESLELVTHQENTNKFTLLGVLDKCLTPGGKRYLRSSILQPSCNKLLITERQACVAEMVEDTTLFSTVQALIRRLCDVDRLLVLGLNTPQKDNISSAGKNLSYALSLKSTLEVLPSLQNALASGRANFFRRIVENLKDERFGIIMDKLFEVLHQDARHATGFNLSTMQRCFAIKSNLNVMLDIARQAYCELIDDMKGMVETLALRYDLPLTLACSASHGYHIQMDSPRRRRTKPTELPPIFIEVQKQKNSYLLTTEHLLVLSQRCRDACEELHLMSNIMLKGMLDAIREHIGCLYQLSNDISELDVIVSLAVISSNSNYTRPIFGWKTELKNSMHPLMEISGTCVPVCNDVHASPTHNFKLITGPNMGGKSVYLRQIVMLQIMAQIGCYVPAEEAQFRIADRIFCRICFGDSIECNASSFILEMKETQYILQMITPTSLVIMDELCRSTTAEEGESIAFAVCEQLLDTRAFVFFTTHFLGLSRLGQWYPNVMNFHFETKSRTVEGCAEPRLIYTHKLVPGIVKTRNYGLALAETCGVPNHIMTKARAIAAKLTDKTTAIDSQGSGADSNKSYDAVALMYRLIQENELTEAKVYEIVEQMSDVGIPRPNEEPESDNNVTAGSTRSSMLSITEKYNRFRKQEWQSDFAEPKPGASKVRDIFSPPSSPPRKKFVLFKSPVHEDVDFDILPSSGGQESNHAITPVAIRQEENAVRRGRPAIRSNVIIRSADPVEKMELEDDKKLSRDFGLTSGFMSSDNVSIVDLVSQLSNDTLEAKISARKKEAAIFREIEGDRFEESEFYGSILSRNNSSSTFDLG